MKKLTKSIDRRRGIGEAPAYASGCQAGGKPSTWFPPEGLVEQTHTEKRNTKLATQIKKIKKNNEGKTKQ